MAVFIGEASQIASSLPKFVLYGSPLFMTNPTIELSESFAQSENEASFA